MRIKKNLTTTMLLVVLALVLLIQGCNTMRGAGEDIEEGGEAVSHKCGEHPSPLNTRQDKSNRNKVLIVFPNHAKCL